MPYRSKDLDDQYPPYATRDSYVYGNPDPEDYTHGSPQRGQAAMRLLPPTRSNVSRSYRPSGELNGRNEAYVYPEDYGADVDAPLSPEPQEYVDNAQISPSNSRPSSPFMAKTQSQSQPQSPIPSRATPLTGLQPAVEDLPGAQGALELAITCMLGANSSASSASPQRCLTPNCGWRRDQPISPIGRAPKGIAPPPRLKTPRSFTKSIYEQDRSHNNALPLLDPLHSPHTLRTPKANSSKEEGTNIPNASRSTYEPHQERQPFYYNNANYSVYPDSRAPSTLGNVPQFAPTNYDQYSVASGSPMRSYSPSRSSMRPPAASNVSYEPRELNGRSRPGTPSGRYGKNPRRPLPPAPLFSAVSGEDEASINIEPHEGDPFADSFSPRRTGHSRFNSRASAKSNSTYSSGSTMVSGEAEEELSKVDLAEDDEDDYTASSIAELYGPAPVGRQDRRGVRAAQMTKKEVKLINGELVLECKIPTILHSFLPRRDDREFTHMRYTAVTCDPDDFVANGYRLRQQIGNTARETEILVCVTMYNEDEVDFTRTMHGVMRNISYLCSRSKSRTWGKDGWQKIVVCIIADGRQKVHPRTLNALAAMGVYQEGIAKNVVNQKEVQAHVYEYTSQVSLAPDMKFKGAEKGIVPCQMVFCLKEQNTKKLNSHRWLFNAFGQALEPNICIMLDVGTKPDPDAIYHLWKAFDQDSNVAGAAGEIKAGKGKNWSGLLNPLVASQNFEYKMSNILDKPIESVFGYITVLPGALSAYRYHALQNDETGHGPLSQYFKGEMLHGQDADVFTANMYLAEDRILCWELVAKRNERWVLKFVKSAVGETDVPDAVPEFISQRRRWLNGAFFAAVYSLLHSRQIWRTDHTIGRKLLLCVEFIYQFVQLIFTFFSLANFYLTFFFIAGSLTDPKQDPFGHNVGKYIFVVLRYACILLICLQFILSMGNRPQGAKKMFLTGMVVYAIIMAYTTFAALYMMINQLSKSGDAMSSSLFTNVIVSMMSTIGLYFFMSFLYLDPWHMFTSSAQYFALLPSYLCTLQIYAFCNTHDISWGTKGDNSIARDLGAARGTGQSTVELEMPSEQLDIDSCYDQALRNLRDRVEVPQPEVSAQQKQEDYYRAVRTYMVSIWLIANAILAMAVSEAYGTESAGNNGYLAFLLWAVAALAAFRAIGSAAFLVIRLIHKLAEGRRKFTAANGSGVSGHVEASTVSRSAQSKQPLAHRNAWEYTRDFITEAGWWIRRQSEKLAFWR